MHPYAIKKIADAPRQISDAATPPTGSGKLSLKMHDEVSYSLPPESASLYSEQVRAILSHADYSKKFSEKHLSKKLDAIFASLLKDDSLDVEEAIQKLLNECDNFKDYSTAYLALEGVQSTICFRFGTVWIAPICPEFIDHLEKKSTSVVLTIKDENAIKESLIGQLKDEFKNEFTNDCAIVFSANAEPSRAIERAREESRFAIDLLRLISKFTLPLRQDIRIGLRGDRPSIRRTGFALSNHRFNTMHDSAGSVLRLNLNKETIRKADELGLLTLSDRYLNNKLTSLDEILIRSIHWLSVALTQDEPETALITLIVALECPFKASAGNSITATVCESTAFLLSNTKDGRLRISAKIREFYGKRSALAHGGKKAVTNIERTLLLQYVSAAVLSVLNHKEVSSQDEFMHWIDEKKFGGVD